MAELTGFNSATIGIGGSTSCAINTSDEVVVWGAAPSGQPALTDAVSVQTNETCVIALRSNGTVEAWGGNSYGQLDVPAGLSGVVQIVMGRYHCLALKSDGTVVGWGLNNVGQTTIPAGLTDVVQVSAGGNTSFALKADGTIQGWGNNGDQQLNVPAGIGPVAQISCGNNFCIALLANGSIETWGNNSAGQRNIPVSVTSPTSILAGTAYGMALQDGGVIMWGSTANGVSTPPSEALSGVVDIFASISGNTAACLLDTGEVLVWGWDFAGETSVPVSLVAMAPGVPPIEGVISAVVQFDASFSGVSADSIGAFTAAVEFTASFSGFNDWLALLDPVQLQEVYLLTVTGDADGLSDIQIPISTWQATRQAAPRQNYLQASIPGWERWVEELEARQNGQLVVSKGYRFPDGSVRADEIVRSDFGDLRYDEGPRSFTLTVSGYERGGNERSGARELKGVRSRNITGGQARIRCEIDMFLQPGMTVSTGGSQFKVGDINYYVSQADKFCEVSER